eukprot:1510526-Rhodomonas_salina.3
MHLIWRGSGGDGKAVEDLRRRQGELRYPPTRCSVLTLRMLLSACAVRGAHAAYGPSLGAVL